MHEHRDSRHTWTQTKTHINNTHTLPIHFSQMIIISFGTEKVEGEEGSVLIENSMHRRNEKTDSIYKLLRKSSSSCSSYL